MKQKVIRIIKRLIGHRILVHPIVDANVYDANENSFSGNSLQDSNVLIDRKSTRLNSSHNA